MGAIELQRMDRRDAERGPPLEIRIIAPDDQSDPEDSRISSCSSLTPLTTAVATLDPRGHHQDQDSLSLNEACFTCRNPLTATTACDSPDLLPTHSQCPGCRAASSRRASTLRVQSWLSVQSITDTATASCSCLDPVDGRMRAVNTALIANNNTTTAVASSECILDKEYLTVPDSDTVYSSTSDIGRRSSIRRASVNLSITDIQNGALSKKHPRKRLSTKYDSLDYNAVESQRFLQEQESVSPKNVQRMAVTRWFINFLVGAYVAVIAVLVYLCIKYISKLKFLAIYTLLDDCDSVSCLLPACLVWILINGGLVFLGSYLVTFHAPEAAGSGIPQVKCYLNGVKFPGLLSLRTLIAKAGGIVLSVCGGLACGKEGPMIHSGAICASGIGRAEFKLGKKKWSPKCCDGLRTDEERRDFVAAGAASGVSAAFASPVGGVLFALEEGASFVNQMLTWRMLFSSFVAGIVLNILMSIVTGQPGNLSQPGLISFGYLGDIKYSAFEIPIFMVMACVGGLLGAAFVQLNYKITLFRRRVMTKPWMKVGEACFVAIVSGLLLITLIYALPDCHPIDGFNTTMSHSNQSHSAAASHDAHGAAQVEEHDVHRRAAQETELFIGSGSGEGEAEHPEVHEVHQSHPSHSADSGHANASHHSPYGDHGHGYMFKGFCPYGEHNRMADILFGTPEHGLHAMLHKPLDYWSILPLVVLACVYHLLTTWTYGLNVSSGLFIPSLLIGATWGRIVGIAVMSYIPAAGTNISKYVLVGAASQLGGFVRMTISLTIILIECTGDITFGLPIIVSLIIAKWMGDFFNPGIYDLHIEIWGVPLLGWEPPDMAYSVKASEVMTAPVQTLNIVEKLWKLKKLLEDEGCHNGFPVVDDYDPDAYGDTYGRLKGFIIAGNLRAIIKDVSDEEKDATIDLRMHMDRTPLSINEDQSLPRIFKLFRGLGLRHLIVVNDRNRVMGMITRINVAKYRSEAHKGHFKVEELEVVDQ